MAQRVDKEGNRHSPTSAHVGTPPAVARAVQLRAQLDAQGTRKKGPGRPVDTIQPVSPPQVNLMEQLQTMFQDRTQSPILLCLGQKGGGKSFRTMTLIMWLLRNNIFDQYFLVLPTFHYEASNSYAWLKPFEEKVFITKEYLPEMSQAFLDRKDETIPPHEIPRTFLWMDDVGMNEAFRTDRQFVGLLSVARHKRLSVCICYHSLTSGHTLSPFLRQNVTHTLLFRVTNEKLLESIFEELISMTGHFPRFRDFKDVYNQHTCSQVNASTGEVQKNFNGICINNAVGCLDWNVADWFPEETQVLMTFLDKMRTYMEEKALPPPAKNQNLKELTPKMVETLPNKNQIDQVMTPESWTQVTKAAAQDPMVFLTHPRNMIRYQKGVDKPSAPRKK
jgi:hypothetical protein